VSVSRIGSMDKLLEKDHTHVSLCSVPSIVQFYFFSDSMENKLLFLKLLGDLQRQNV